MVKKQPFSHIRVEMKIISAKSKMEGVWPVLNGYMRAYWARSGGTEDTTIGKMLNKIGEHRV